MARVSNVRVVLVTCGSRKEARSIAKAVVQKRLAACVNVVSTPVESFYRWKGRLESAREFLLIVKTAGSRINELEKEIARLHSYDVPEFLVIGVNHGSRPYVRWLSENV
jgi:periplasmic divalent cation tolerance protein